jgi:hypothetical protein
MNTNHNVCEILYVYFSRASKANDLVKRVYGSLVPVLNGENLSVRVLVSRLCRAEQ